MENLNELGELLNLVYSFIPDGVEEKLEVNGCTITLNKNGNKINVVIASNNEVPESTNAFDDSEVKSLIADYKKSIEGLDDCLFLNALEDMRNTIDVKRFDELLNKESFTEEEANEVAHMINISTAIIHDHLESKIQELLKTFIGF